MSEQVERARMQVPAKVAEALAIVADPDLLAVEGVLAGDLRGVVMEGTESGTGPFVAAVMQGLAWKGGALMIAANLRAKIGLDRFHTVQGRARQEALDGPS
jgi:hypothetical protein